MSDGVAEEFYTFLQEYERLPRYTQIKESPETTHIPSEGSTKYALVSMLVDYTNEDTITNIVNADIKSSAAIAFSKMENLTASRALVSDGSGDVSVSAVTSTDLCEAMSFKSAAPIPPTPMCAVLNLLL